MKLGPWLSVAMGLWVILRPRPAAALECHEILLLIDGAPIEIVLHTISDAQPPPTEGDLRCLERSRAPDPVLDAVARRSGAVRTLPPAPAPAAETPCPGLTISTIAFGGSPTSMPQDFPGCDVSDPSPRAESAFLGFSEQATKWYSAGLDPGVVYPSLPEFVREVTVSCDCWERSPDTLSLFYRPDDQGQLRLFGVEKYFRLDIEGSWEGALSQLATGVQSALPGAAQPSVNTDFNAHTMGGTWRLYRWRTPAIDALLTGGSGGTMGSLEAYSLTLSRQEWDAVVQRQKAERARIEAESARELHDVGRGL